MASAGQREPSPQPLAQDAPVSLGARVVAALALLAGVALLYGLLALFGALPRPGSVAALARAQAIGRYTVIVPGYYVTQHFESMGGPQLPPYVFAQSPQPGAPGVHVSPELVDVRAGKVAGVILTATGDGSEGSPFVIHTLARWDSFVTAVIVGVLIAVAFALWLAGTVVGLVRPRP